MHNAELGGRCINLPRRAFRELGGKRGYLARGPYRSGAGDATYTTRREAVREAIRDSEAT